MSPFLGIFHVWNGEEALDCHLTNLKLVIFVILFFFHQVWKEGFEYNEVDYHYEALEKDQHHNCVEEIEEHEDRGPGADPEDDIEEEDGIELEVVDKSVGFVAEKELLHDREGHCQDTTDDRLDLASAWWDPKFSEDNEDLKEELWRGLHKTLTEFEFHVGSAEGDIVTEDSSESYDKPKHWRQEENKRKDY